MLIKQAITNFIYAKPELAKLLLSCKVRKSSRVPTMAVNITRQPNLYINEDFLSELTEDEANAVITHEMYHLLNLHPARGKDKQDMIFNYAADIAINQYIDNLPEGVLDVEEFKTIDEFKDLESKRSTEYYYYKLEKEAKKAKKKLQQSGKDGGSGQMDEKHVQGHEKWKESVDEEQARKVVQDIIDKKSMSLSDEKNNIDKETMKQYRHYGNEGIDKYQELDSSKLQKVNWDSLLNKIRNVRYKRVKQKTIHRRNKRYGFLPGRVRRKKKLTDGNRIVKRLFVAVDVSGSISNKMCSTFLENCKDLEPHVDDLTIIQCSARIHDVEEIKKDGKKLKEIDFERKGNGGTDFIPVFQHITDNYDTEENDYYLLYLTDTHGSFPEDNNNIKTFWISCVEENYTEPPFGEIYFFDDY